MNEGMIESLATAIEFRSGESGDHVRRIHDITKFLLSHTDLGTGLTTQDIEHIALASIMHDVGKIAIPDAILNKPGRLTAEEFEVIKTHTIRGACWKKFLSFGNMSRIITRMILPGIIMSAGTAGDILTV